ncbi:YlaH-like family protein [Brevibacillus sp. SYSU BS000544]|uniref:YlaH-like family protein n=1 Tax=Brevibacillus sp. SYSU BS000544 TaxID=3416443 RepID=UPI003CE481A6
MEWVEMVSNYVSTNNPPSSYDQLRIWFDDMRLFVIFALLIMVYYAGFATRMRMPILKTVLLWIALFVGAILFTILDVMGLPVRAALFVALLVMLLARLRRKDIQEES